MIFRHGGLKISGRQMAGFGLLTSPMDEQAVGKPAKDAQEQHPLVALDPATVVVVRNVEALMQAAFNPPAITVDLEPLRRVEAFGWQARDQGHRFVFPTRGLPQETRSLTGKGKADVFPRQFAGGDTAVFVTPFIFPRPPRLRRGGPVEGGNPLEERESLLRCSPAGWAGCL